MSLDEQWRFFMEPENPERYGKRKIEAAMAKSWKLRFAKWEAENDFFGKRAFGLHVVLKLSLVTTGVAWTWWILCGGH